MEEIKTYAPNFDYDALQTLENTNRLLSTLTQDFGIIIESTAATAASVAFMVDFECGDGGDRDAGGELGTRRGNAVDGLNTIYDLRPAASGIYFNIALSDSAAFKRHSKIDPDEFDELCDAVRSEIRKPHERPFRAN